MPSVAVKLYSVYFKLVLKHKLQSLLQQQVPNPKSSSSPSSSSSFGITSRSDESTAASNPTFSSSDGVATKDIHIDTLTSLSIRIFLPSLSITNTNNSYTNGTHRSSYSDGTGSHNDGASSLPRRSSYDGLNPPVGSYRGYLPPESNRSNGKLRKLPIVLQFHGGAFVSGSNVSASNDMFCRRIAKLLDVIVIAVGYRLAPESRYPAAFEDGMKVLNWVRKQANLAECSKSLGERGWGKKGGEGRRAEEGRRIVDTFGAASVEPWLAAHGDPSRCVLLGVSCGANIADHVARKAVEADRLMEPVKVVAQVLMYPFFIGSVPTQSELRLANSYFYDKSMSTLAWRLFLPGEEFNLDHPAANPLLPGRGPPLRHMPPTLTVVAEHDWMRDRAIAYSEELRKVNVDAPVLEYKDAVHGFATLDVLLRTPQAQACAEDVAIWVKKHISLCGHEFSY